MIAPLLVCGTRTRAYVYYVKGLVLETEGDKLVTPGSQAAIFCLTQDKSGDNFTFTWLRQLEGSSLPPQVQAAHCTVL